jgi:hypothetical protein
MAPIENKIQDLQGYFNSDPNTFEFQASIIISGDGNKATRQQIIERLTGKKPPMSKCGYYSTVNALKNYFSQPTLF